MKPLRISTSISPSGFTTHVDSKSIYTIYPQQAWHQFPEYFRKPLADTLSYFATHHFTLSKNKQIDYAFPPPAASSIYFHGFFYSMADAAGEFPKEHLLTSNVLQKVYNSDFAIRFSGIPYPITAHAPFKPEKKSVIVPFSFGKDSLLTTALLQEHGYAVHLIFFEEPTCGYQNKIKHELIKSFERTSPLSVTVFRNPLGNLRDPDGLLWGWDMLLTQYTLLLLPYVYQMRASYVLWSNEQSTNDQSVDKEGYMVNATHEQSTRWVLHLNNLYRLFGTNTTVGSILEPLHEIVILWILHTRYPAFAQYQLSCDLDTVSSHRWCGDCYECARVYLFFTALGLDPHVADLHGDMLAESKRKLHYLFTDKEVTTLDKLLIDYGERLLAFYLVYKRGIKGALVDEFAQRFLPLVEKNKKRLVEEHFSLHEPRGSLTDLYRVLFPVYKEELKKLRKSLSKWI